MAGLHRKPLRCAASQRSQHAGFTLVELVLVIVLIGILASVAFSRFFERSSFDVEAWSSQVKTVLRYAQKRAIAQRAPVYIQLSADRIALCGVELAVCPPASRISAPGGSNSGAPATNAACASTSWMCEGRPDGVQMTVPLASFWFDPLGRAITPSGIDLRLDISGGGVARSVMLTAETGHVE